MIDLGKIPGRKRYRRTGLPCLRNRVGSLNSISIFDLYKWADLKSNRTIRWTGLTFEGITALITSRYSIEIQFEYYGTVRQHIPLAWTNCIVRNRAGVFGGTRPWFTCPNCHRRAAYLYCDGPQYQCRNCLNLIYESQLKSAKGRKFRTLEKLKQRLGGYGALNEPIPPRPYQMKRATYARIAGKAHAIEAQLGIGGRKMASRR